MDNVRDEDLSLARSSLLTALGFVRAARAGAVVGEALLDQTMEAIGEALDLLASAEASVGEVTITDVEKDG